MKTKRDWVSAFIVLMIFLVSCSPATPPPTPTPMPSPTPETTSVGESFFNGMGFGCGVLPESPDNPAPAYTAEDCINLVNKAIADDKFPENSNLELPATVDDPVAAEWYRGALYACQSAPAKPPSTFVNKYSQAECNDLIAQMIANGYFKQYQSIIPG